MTGIDDLPDKILVKIFLYFPNGDMAHTIRKVCTRWRKVSEKYKIWKYCSLWAYAGMTENSIVLKLKAMPALDVLMYFGRYNVLKSVSEHCRRIALLCVPNIHITADVLQLVMDRLPMLSHLIISVNPTPEGLQITRIIGKSGNFQSLELRSFGQEGIMDGLLMPIAEGCPNLKYLKCANFNCRDSELCYLMHRKSCQLITYLPTGVVSASTIQALNQCPNVKRVVFTRTSFKEPFPEIPHITRLPKLRILEVLKCNYPMLHLIPLTLFRNTLSHLIYIRICEIFGNVDFLISKILLKCPLLKRLDLEKNHELTCEALRNISSCKLLTRLSVSHCQNVDKKAIQYVAEGCPQLQHLDVSGIPMSDELFRQILRCRTLTLLMMTFTDVSVIDLDLISTNIPGLKELLIGPKYKFGHDCTRDIKQHMPHLNIWAPQFASDIQDYYTQKYEYVNLHTGYKDDPSDLMK